LRDQRIGQSGLKASTQEAGTELARSLPIAVKDFEAGHGANERGKIAANTGVTKEFGHYNWRKHA